MRVRSWQRDTFICNTICLLFCQSFSFSLQPITVTVLGGSVTFPSVCGTSPRLVLTGCLQSSALSPPLTSILIFPPSFPPDVSFVGPSLRHHGGGASARCLVACSHRLHESEGSSRPLEEKKKTHWTSLLFYSEIEHTLLELSFLYLSLAPTPPPPP